MTDDDDDRVRARRSAMKFDYEAFRIELQRLLDRHPYVTGMRADVQTTDGPYVLDFKSQLDIPVPERSGYEETCSTLYLRIKD